MKIINSGPAYITNNARWMILDEVTDNDAAALRFAGWDYVYDVDMNGHSHDGDENQSEIDIYEMWWDIKEIEKNGEKTNAH